MTSRSLLCLAFALASQTSSADNWPRFRGPNGTAAAPSASIPAEWKPEHIRWKFALPGPGISSPCIWDDSLFVTWSDAKGETRTLGCLSASTGEKRWEQSFKFTTHRKHKKNAFATSTPATDGERVYVEFGDPERFVVAAFDFKGGKVWERDLGPYIAEHAGGASPIVHEGRLFVTDEQDGPSSIVCLDAKTGADVWRTPRTPKRTSYSTPFILKRADGDQLICSSLVGIQSYDVATGVEKWRCNQFALRTVGSPIALAGLIVATSGEGGSGKKLIAVSMNPTAKGDVAPAYDTTQAIPYCTTPLGLIDRFFFVTDGGVARLLNGSDGSEIWAKRLGGNFSSSPVLVGDKVVIPAEDGRVFVLAASGGYKQLALNRFDDGFLSTAAVAGNRLFLRGNKFVYCIGDK